MDRNEPEPLSSSGPCPVCCPRGAGVPGRPRFGRVCPCSLHRWSNITAPRPANLLAGRAAGSRRAHESARPGMQVAQGGASHTGRKADPQACPQPAGQRQEALTRPLPAGGHATTYLCPRPRPRRVHFPLLPGPDGGKRREVGVTLPHLRQLLLLHLRFERETGASPHDLTCAYHDSDRHPTIFV